MDWRNWRTWLLLVGGILAIFAIYTFASPNTPRDSATMEQGGPQDQRAGLKAERTRVALTGGLEPIHREWLEPQSGTFRSGRNLFSFVEPPPPPPPKPVLPPDRDGDGVPDHLDNCPDVYNPDQTDLDRNGIGAACQEGVEIPPPPPPPTPPAFPYKYLGTFGTASRPIAAFSSGDQIVNVRVGETFGGHFILRSIGIESVDIGFVGFPPDVTKRIPVGP